MLKSLPAHLRCGIPHRQTHRRASFHRMTQTETFTEPAKTRGLTSAAIKDARSAVGHSFTAADVSPRVFKVRVSGKGNSVRRFVTMRRMPQRIFWIFRILGLVVGAALLASGFAGDLYTTWRFSPRRAMSIAKSASSPIRSGSRLSPAGRVRCRCTGDTIAPPMRALRLDNAPSIATGFRSESQ